MCFGLLVPEFSSNLLKRTQTQHAYISLSTTACEVITAKEYTLICFKQPLMQNRLDSVMLPRCSLAMPHARCAALLPCTSPEQHSCSSVFCPGYSRLLCASCWALPIPNWHVPATPERTWSFLEGTPLFSGKMKLLLAYMADALGFPLTQGFLIAPGSFLDWNLVTARRDAANLAKPCSLSSGPLRMLWLKADVKLTLKARIIRNDQIWGEQPNWRAWVLCHHAEVSDITCVRDLKQPAFLFGLFPWQCWKNFSFVFDGSTCRRMLTKSTVFPVFFFPPLMFRKKRASTFSF